jgi:hypothetical protein
VYARQAVARCWRELGQRFDRRCQPTFDQLQRFLHQQRITVVGHEGAGRAEMQNAAGLGSLFSEVAQVGDHVVACLGLDFGDALQIQFGRGITQRVELLLGNGQTQLTLAFRQSDPHSTPELITVRGGEQGAHLSRRIAFVEGILRGLAHGMGV